MNLKYDKNNIKIYNDDCLNLVKNLLDNSVSLIVTSPPYCMKKAYENKSDDINTFNLNNEYIIKECIRVLKPGGSLCWQVGYHVNKNETIPLDILIYNIVDKINQDLADENKLVLRNRIVWSFGHGLNATLRFSGRHETILWFTKGSEYTFNLDCVRIPQKYPGKTHSKGKKKGQISGNPLGKNPSDVWDIPNVNANHVEKTEHPCQFPEALVQRLILALTNENEVVLDPYLGSGTTALACYLNNRKFLGSELEEQYINICLKRLENAEQNIVKIREDIPVKQPDPNTKVAKKPDNFLW